MTVMIAMLPHHEDPTGLPVARMIKGTAGGGKTMSGRETDKNPVPKPGVTVVNVLREMNIVAGITMETVIGETKTGSEEGTRTKIKRETGTEEETHTETRVETGIGAETPTENRTESVAEIHTEDVTEMVIETGIHTEKETELGKKIGTWAIANSIGIGTETCIRTKTDTVIKVVIVTWDPGDALLTQKSKALIKSGNKTIFSTEMIVRRVVEETGVVVMLMTHLLTVLVKLTKEGREKMMDGRECSVVAEQLHVCIYRVVKLQFYFVVLCC